MFFKKNKNKNKKPLDSLWDIYCLEFTIFLFVFLSLHFLFLF